MHIAKQQPSQRTENVAKTFPNATWEYHSVCCAKLKQKSAENIPVACTNRVFRFVAQCVFAVSSENVFPGLAACVCVFVSRNVPVFASQCICSFVSECVSGLRLRFRAVITYNHKLKCQQGHCAEATCSQSSQLRTFRMHAWSGKNKARSLTVSCGQTTYKLMNVQHHLQI